MFPNKFKVDHKEELFSHHAISFHTKETQKVVVDKLIKMGVAAFVTPDNPLPTNYDPSWQGYNDGRIAGNAMWHIGSQCCSFTRNADRWYLFPIHENQLNNVGLTGDDLVKWIMFLNSTKAGFKYMYLGVQEGNDEMEQKFTKKIMVTSNKYHWICVPKFAVGTNNRKCYAHWIALRYLINTNKSGGNLIVSNTGKIIGSEYGEKERFPYYMIPRITMYLHEELGMPKFKSFMYAHLANPFYYYYGLTYSDRLVTDVCKFDVSFTAAEFSKALSANITCGMNDMTCVANGQRYLGEYLKRTFTAPYDHMKLYQLFDAGDYKGFVKKIEEAYNINTKPQKRKRNVAKKEVIN